MDEVEVFTREKMKDEYGDFWNASPRGLLSSDRVPNEIHPLIPYAEFWGITDDWAREALIKNAMPAVRENMKRVVKLYEELWEPWLTGPEAEVPNPSDEFVAFAALVMAADYA